MIAIIDYGVGNLFSLRSSFDALGIEAKITADPEEIRNSDKIVLPGVGAFRDAINKLNTTGLGELVVSESRNGKPLLGICLGMQLLLDKSYEFGEYDGLGLVPGEVRPISEVISKDLKIPQMGWNALHFTNGSPIFKNSREGDYVYFVHSYYCKSPAEYITAVTEYDAELTASVQNGNVFGCQFHPEKSGPVGLRILKAFDSIR